MTSSLKTARARRSRPPKASAGGVSDNRKTTPLPSKPPRHIPRVFPNPPPPEGASLRDRSASSPDAFVEETSTDTLAEQMGQDSVRAMTSAQDEAPALADGERIAELGGPFLETGPLTGTGSPQRTASTATDRSRRA